MVLTHGLNSATYKIKKHAIPSLLNGLGYNFVVIEYKEDDGNVIQQIIL